MQSNQVPPTSMPTSSQAECVGFVGLGEMGLPMAAHLVAGGFGVVAYDALAARRDDAAERGIRWAASAPAVAAAATRTVVVMVRTLAQVESAVLGEDGCLAAGREPIDLLIMSTVDPGAMRE